MNEGKIKIAFLMQESRMAGIEYNTLAITKALDRARFEINFICPREGRLTVRCRELGVPYYIVKGPKFFSTSSQFGERFVILNPIAVIYDLCVFISLASRYNLFLRKKKFDIICTKGLMANFYGSIAKLGTNARCVWDMQEVVDRKRVFGLLAFIVNLWALFFADCVIAASQAIREQFYKILWKKIFLIYNGVSCDEFNLEKVNRLKVRREFHVRDDQVVIGHIARFAYWKGQLDFIRAAEFIHKAHPEIKFFLVGDSIFGPSRYKQSIMNEIKRLNLGDAFIPLGFREDIPSVLAAIDVFVHSPIKAEGCPLTVISAMTMAKAIIATEVPGLNELISERSGILVPPSSPRHIAEAVNRLIENTEEREAMGYEARKKAKETFALKMCAEEIEKVFLNLKDA